MRHLGNQTMGTHQLKLARHAMHAATAFFRTARRLGMQNVENVSIAETIETMLAPQNRQEQFLFFRVHDVQTAAAPAAIGNRLTQPVELSFGSRRNVHNGQRVEVTLIRGQRTSR